MESFPAISISEGGAIPSLSSAASAPVRWIRGQTLIRRLIYAARAVVVATPLGVSLFWGLRADSSFAALHPLETFGAFPYFWVLLTAVAVGLFGGALATYLWHPRTIGLSSEGLIVTELTGSRTIPWQGIVFLASAQRGVHLALWSKPGEPRSLFYRWVTREQAVAIGSYPAFLSRPSRTV